METTYIATDPLLWGISGVILTLICPLWLARAGTIIGGSILALILGANIATGAVDAAFLATLTLGIWMLITFTLLGIRDHTDTGNALADAVRNAVYPTAGIDDPPAGTGTGPGRGGPPNDTPADQDQGWSRQDIAQVIDGVLGDSPPPHQPPQHPPGTGPGHEDPPGQPPGGGGQTHPAHADDQGIVPPDDDNAWADVEDIDAFRQ